VLSCVLLIFARNLLGAASRIVVIVAGSVILLYLVAPAANFLRRFMPKHFAVILTFLGVFAVLVGLAAVVLPPLISQGQQLAGALPGATAKAQVAIRDPENPFFRSLPAFVRNELALAPDRMRTLITRFGVTIARQGVAAALSAFSLFLTFIIIPVLAIYLMFDYSDLEHGLLGFVPKQYHPKAIAILRDLSRVMGAFVRGQVLDGLCVGTMIFIWLLIMKVPFALVIAVAAGIFNLIPYVGAIAGFVPSVLLALAFNGWENALIVAIGFAVIQQIDGDFIVPRIMNASVKLSPVVIIVSIVTFASFFGILGALLAVPIAAMLRVFKLHFAPGPPMDQFRRDEQASTAYRQFN
jgi:predicted PurR-regulated permease PerM